MARPQLLDDEAQRALLKALGEPWEIVGKVLRGTFQTTSYQQGLDLVASAGALAEALDHHPTLTLDYGRLTVAITTHDAGGLTELDFSYASGVSERYASSKLR